MSINNVIREKILKKYIDDYEMIDTSSTPGMPENVPVDKINQPEPVRLAETSVFGINIKGTFTLKIHIVQFGSTDNPGTEQMRVTSLVPDDDMLPWTPIVANAQHTLKNNASIDNLWHYVLMGIPIVEFRRYETIPFSGTYSFVSAFAGQQFSPTTEGQMLFFYLLAKSLFFPNVVVSSKVIKAPLNFYVNPFDPTIDKMQYNFSLLYTPLQGQTPIDATFTCNLYSLQYQNPNKPEGYSDIGQLLENGDLKFSGELPQNYPIILNKPYSEASGKTFELNYALTTLEDVMISPFQALNITDQVYYTLMMSLQYGGFSPIEKIYVKLQPQGNVPYNISGTVQSYFITAVTQQSQTNLYEPFQFTTQFGEFIQYSVKFQSFFDSNLEGEIDCVFKLVRVTDGAEQTIGIIQNARSQQKFLFPFRIDASQALAFSASVTLKLCFIERQSGYYYPSESVLNSQLSNELQQLTVISLENKGVLMIQQIQPILCVFIDTNDYNYKFELEALFAEEVQGILDEENGDYNVRQEKAVDNGQDVVGRFLVPEENKERSKAMQIIDFAINLGKSTEEGTISEEDFVKLGLQYFNSQKKRGAGGGKDAYTAEDLQKSYRSFATVYNSADLFKSPLLRDNIKSQFMKFSTGVNALDKDFQKASELTKVAQKISSTGIMQTIKNRYGSVDFAKLNADEATTLLNQVTGLLEKEKGIISPEFGKILLAQLGNTAEERSKLMGLLDAGTLGAEAVMGIFLISLINPAAGPALAYGFPVVNGLIKSITGNSLGDLFQLWKPLKWGLNKAGSIFSKLIGTDDSDRDVLDMFGFLADMNELDKVYADQDGIFNIQDDGFNDMKQLELEEWKYKMFIDKTPKLEGMIFQDIGPDGKTYHWYADHYNADKFTRVDINWVAKAYMEDKGLTNSTKDIFAEDVQVWARNKYKLIRASIQNLKKGYMYNATINQSARKALMTEAGQIVADESSLAAFYMKASSQLMQRYHSQYVKYLINPNLTRTVEGRSMTTVALGEMLRKINSVVQLSNPYEEELIIEAMLAYFKKAGSYCALTENLHGAVQFRLYQALLKPFNSMDMELRNSMFSYMYGRRLYDSTETIQVKQFQRLEEFRNFLSHPDKVQEYVEKITHYVTPSHVKAKLGYFYIGERPQKLRLDYDLLKIRQLGERREERQPMERKEPLKRTFSQAQKIRQEFGLPQRTEDDMKTNQLFETRKRFRV